nr:uncharacterized protein LOC128698471 isoform X1 [Cherax quadricarinatus]
MDTKILEDIVHLLQDVQWLYNFPVTQIFTRNVIYQMPGDWREALTELPIDELNLIPQCKSQDYWPTSLQSFLERCKRLSLQQLVLHQYGPSTAPLTHTSHTLQLPQEFSRGMSLKKRHEVSALLSLMKNLSESTQSSHVLDVGSGIGYIDSLLHHSLKLTVFGAESEDKNVRSANNRHQQLSGKCKGVRHFTWTLADDEVTIEKAKQVIIELIHLNENCTCQHKKSCSLSSNASENLLMTVDNEPETEVSSINRDNAETVVPADVCQPHSSAILLGLHACADLSPVMIKIFKECPQVSSLVLLSCCYHKIHPANIPKNSLGNESNYCDGSDPYMKVETSFEKVCCDTTEREGSIANEVSFVNFPMSAALRNMLNQNDFNMSVFGLRLAAQESGLRWRQQTSEDHENHKKNVAYRGLLEVFCIREGFTLRKLRRRCVRKSQFEGFSDYIKNVTMNYEFISSDGAVHIARGNEKNVPLEDTILSFQRGESNKINYDENTFKSMDSTSCQDHNISATGEVLNITQDYIKNALEKCYEEFQHLFPLIEPITGLQLALQPVMEALVYVDRLVYLKESGYTNVWLEKVFDAEVSPRSVALIVVR